jgi:hypothetical protein
VLRRAVGALAGIEPQSYDELFTDDVVVTTPGASFSTLAELAVELDDREVAFDSIEVELSGCDVVGDRGYVEWLATATHVAPFVVDDEVIIEPTGNGLTLHGVTVADFSGERISSMRQYWDEMELLGGLGVLQLD